MDVQTTIAIVNTVCASASFAWLFVGQCISHGLQADKENDFHNGHNPSRPQDDRNDNTEREDERADLAGLTPKVHYLKALLSLALMIVLTFVSHPFIQSSEFD
jgi:hypothetical protein